jgi:uncharacterized membrane protein YfcA
MLAGWELAIGLAAVFLGALVLGTISFGMGTLAMPFLLFILEPKDAVVIVNSLVVVTTGLTLIQTWRHLNLKQSWPFLVAGLPPVPIGVLLLHGADPVALRLIIGVVAVMSLFRIHLPGAQKPLAAPICGFITTLMATSLGVGAALGGLYAIEQDWSRDTIRATLGLYFFLAAALALVLFVASGLLGVTTAKNLGVLTLAVLAGSALAAVVARRISLQVFRYVVVAVTVVGSLSLLSRELLRVL